MKLDFIDNLPAEWQPQIQEYLQGKRQKFDVKITLTGTEFQKSVWNEMLKIPYGSVLSYSDLAKAIGKPKAARAVGNACNTNKYPIIIPCHRIVSKNGIGGYAFGLKAKRYLLKLENAPQKYWKTQPNQKTTKTK